MAEKRTRRSFTREFKARAVKRLLEGGKGLSEVATELGVSTGQLSTWRREQLAAGSAEALAPTATAACSARSADPCNTLPVRLSRRPVPLAAVGLSPGRSVPLLRWDHGGPAYRVYAAEGPERIEPEWWRDRPGRPARDYWRMELASGARFWVCRVALAAPDGGGRDDRWFLHGLFA
jgi:transposase-like protein